MLILVVKFNVAISNTPEDWINVYSSWLHVPSLGSFFWPSAGCTPARPCPPCTEDSTPGCSTPGEVSPVQSRGAGSPTLPCWPHFFWCSPSYNWLSELQGHIAGSCPACHPLVPPSAFQQGCAPSLYSLYSPSCTCGGCYARPCTWLSWNWRGSLEPVWISLDGIPSLGRINCTTHSCNDGNKNFFPELRCYCGIHHKGLWDSFEYGERKILLPARERKKVADSSRLW